MIITYKIDPEDAYVCAESDRIIDFSQNDSFSYTFWKIKDRFPSWYDTRALDILYLSFAVFSADRLFKRDDAEDGWSRDFKLNVPVINEGLFLENAILLQEMISFLTGDRWTFSFRKRSLTQSELLHRNRPLKKGEAVKEYDRICMFSGGLDSFVGAIDLLERQAEEKILFVSHYGGGKGTKEYQDYLKTVFAQQYELEERDFCQFYAKAVGGVEDTTRSRSFMFFAHAVALASAQGKTINIIIPENGLISLNIPSTFSRIGTSSTRTTHPYYMKKFQEFLNNLGLSITFSNPYQFKTKGEMLVECKNQEFMTTHLNNTMSCSHPDIGRMHSEKESCHCGYCLPCVIRQAAILRAGINDTGSYRDRLFESDPNAKTIRNSYLLGLKRFNPDVAFMTIQQNGPVDNKIEEFASVYTRGMQELKQYMDTVI